LAHSHLAPVQCTTWGHPSTTGLDTVDYFLSSELLETEDADAHYTERLIRLSTLPTYYVRPALPREFRKRKDFGLPNDAHIYICPQSLFKLHPDFDQVMRGILHRDPKAVIVLIAGLQTIWQHQLRDRLRHTLPDCHERVLVTPRVNAIDFQHLLACADVMLDPLHFSGGNTSYQAFATGMPIVTLPSEFMRGRVTAAQCQLMGLSDTVVSNTDEYIQRATDIAMNPDYRAALKTHILEHNNALYENANAVSEMEQFFEHAVEWHQAHHGVRPPAGLKSRPSVLEPGSRIE